MANTTASNLSFNKRANIVDLTTEHDSNIKDSNPVYLIDKRLLNSLLTRVKDTTFPELQAELVIEVQSAKDKDDMFNKVDEFIYMNSIINHVNFPKNKEEEPIKEVKQAWDLHKSEVFPNNEVNRD